ncbi:unnamed protein product [Rhodiola kirilowii]
MEKEVEVLTNRLQGELTVAIKKEARKRAEEEYKWAVVLRLSNGKTFQCTSDGGCHEESVGYRGRI